MTNPIATNDAQDLPTFPHTSAVLLSIGDELTLGQKLDTNTQWLAQQLTDLGINIIEHRTLADDAEQITSAFTLAAQTAPLVLVTGGLGPTDDDLTRAALAGALGETLIDTPEGTAMLEAAMHKLGRRLNDLNKRQAQRPPSAKHIPNDRGTAPGLHATVPLSRPVPGPVRTANPPGTKHPASDIYCMPGPPREMHPMFEQLVLPELRVPANQRVITRVLHLYGLGESDAAGVLGDLMDRGRNPLVGVTASGGVISVRIRAEGSGDDLQYLVDQDEQRIRELFPELIWGTEDETLEGVVVKLLNERNEKVTAAESCTGGTLAGRITSVSGSSSVFDQSWVTYANAAKNKLIGVPTELLEGPDAPGAVSEPTAIAMAEGALVHAPTAQHALGITGIAGPTGGSDEKPVGTVCIALSSRASTAPEAAITTDVRTFRILGDRQTVRNRATTAALGLLCARLAGRNLPNVLWQVS